MYSISTSYALRDVIQIKSGMYTRVLNFISRHCLDYLASGIITDSDNTLGVYRAVQTHSVWELSRTAPSPPEYYCALSPDYSMEQWEHAFVSRDNSKSQEPQMTESCSYRRILLG